MMDFRPSDLVYIMSTQTNYYQLPVLLVKTTRYSRNHTNLNLDAKIGACSEHGDRKSVVFTTW